MTLTAQWLASVQLGANRNFAARVGWIRRGNKLRPYFAYRNDHVVRNIQTACRRPDRLRAGRFIQAIGLALVRAQNRPLNADLIVYLLDFSDGNAVVNEFLSEIPFDQEERHDSLLCVNRARWPLVQTAAESKSSKANCILVLLPMMFSQV